MSLEPLRYEDREQLVGRLANSDYAISVEEQAGMTEDEIAKEAARRFNVFWKDLHTYFGQKHNVMLTMLFQVKYLFDILEVYGTPIHGTDYPVTISVYTKTFDAFKRWVE